MKLALIADSFPPGRNSGAVQLRDLTREFIRQGHDLTVLLPDPDLDKPWALDEFDGAQVLRLRAPRTRDLGYAKRTLGEFLMPYAMLRGLRKSPVAAQRWEGIIWYSPSIFHGPLVRALKCESRCKGYLIIRDIFPEWAVDLGLLRPGLVYQFFRRIARQQYEVADIIGVQTSGNLSYFEDWHQRGLGRTLEVLQNWLDAPTVDQCHVRIDQTALAGRKVFVYAGNMGIAQGLDVLLDLASEMTVYPDVGFLFVGRGSEVKRLKEQAAARALGNVLFHDEIDPDEIPDLYAQCHAGLVALDPRHKSHNIPGKFLSYMQNGLPVLAVVNPGNDLAKMIREARVGEVTETTMLHEITARCLALVNAIETDHNLSERCVRLFEDKFSTDIAVRQITAALR